MGVSITCKAPYFLMAPSLGDISRQGVVFYDGHAAPKDVAAVAGLSDQRGAAVITDFDLLVHASARFENLLRSNGQWFKLHPWLLTFLRGSNAEGGSPVRFSRTGLATKDVGPFRAD